MAVESFALVALGEGPIEVEKGGTEAFGPLTLAASALEFTRDGRGARRYGLRHIRARLFARRER